ncbi:MAG: hypothetical protein R2867_17130 [Caldilineaceae bacterium]
MTYRPDMVINALNTPQVSRATSSIGSTWLDHGGADCALEPETLTIRWVVPARP